MKILALLLTCCCGLACAQSPAGSTDVAVLTRLRMEMVTAPDYNGYVLQGKESGMAQRAKAEWAAGHADATIAAIDALLAAYPASLLGHRMMAETAQELVKHSDDPQRQESLRRASTEHQAVFHSLIQSIKGDTECASPADHCKVITIREEYMVLLDAGFVRRQQALVFNDGVAFDVLTGDNAQGEKRSFYFDISSFYKTL